jgi:hypothetical protein
MFMNPLAQIPPVTIVLISTFLAIMLGIICKDMLEYQVNSWYANRQTQDRIHYQTAQSRVAYTLLTLFTYLSMGSSLSVLGFFNLLAYGVGFVVVVPTALLLWFQLGSMLELMVRGGSAAINIDAYGASE